jgi:hypothetical protein
MNRFLSIDEVVDNARTIIPGVSAEDKVIFRQWVVWAMRDIGPNKDWIKACRINRKDGSFKKPNDFITAVGIALYSTDGVEVPYIYQSGGIRIHTDRTQIYDSTSTGEVTTQRYLSEDAYYFHVGGNTDDLGYILLRYYALPVDKYGYPLIEEDNMLAYVNFCSWMWSRRKGDNRSEIAQNYDFWIMERDRIKGRNKMVSIPEAEGIFKKYLNMLHGPTYKTF